MRWTFDANADAFYLYLSDGSPASQVDLGDGMIVDLDETGAPVGIEVLGSNRALDLGVLETLGVPADVFVMLGALVAQPFPVIGPSGLDVRAEQDISLMNSTELVVDPAA